ncbi:unnamed protein product [Cuscuta epithymum]|uniref:Thioesterase domain-containing protein n=1 Tax=Cuscuta epithymum TaxID=186058 RepID=A0AAV0FTL1_9ASTE|nr:unnamed protein product [Cuscuta epithymum]
MKNRKYYPHSPFLLTASPSSLVSTSITPSEGSESTESNPASSPALSKSLVVSPNGVFASGAIANLVDKVGGAVVYVEGLPMNVSVDMSISYLSTAKFNDELEIIGRCLGKIGGYSGTSVLVRNKLTGELIAEGRHSLFGKHVSKM